MCTLHNYCELQGVHTNFIQLKLGRNVHLFYVTTYTHFPQIIFLTPPRIEPMGADSFVVLFEIRQNFRFDIVKKCGNYRGVRNEQFNICSALLNLQCK